ncbi:hypothetical protein AAFF_G00238290 [Aldrovandia affinis]|uniref:Regulation of nuclear pre-mRNA domain-containing protein 2 n=1 Tax=Aldrovandia affinis TaxID=143900 RepID=A0AAD7REA9_9TELE|nr:hypothetical protein AAFF_G00238290 [Aldrovandia affinis]
MAAGTGAASGHSGRGSSAALQSSLDRRFQGVSNTMESIQGLSNWCIENKKHHNLIVRYWMKWLRKSGASHRLNLFYLANDVIQNCKRKNAIIYRNAFSEVLPEASRLVKDGKVRKSVERILTIWEERSVYPEELISELRAGLTKKAPPAGQSSTVNPKAALKSKIVAEFAPQSFIEQLSVHKRTIEEAELKEKQLAALRVDVCSTEALKRLKDKAGGKKFSKDFEDGSTKLQDFVSFLEQQAKGGPPLLEALSNADVFYEMQYKEVKIIANAYKTFANRVTHLKRKLDTLKGSLPGPEDSPVPSPSEDAPSPTGSESPFHDLGPGVVDIDGEAMDDGDVADITLGDVPSPLSSPGASPPHAAQHGEKDNRDVEDMELSEGEESESPGIIVEERVEKPAPIAVPKPALDAQTPPAQEGDAVKQTTMPPTPPPPPQQLQPPSSVTPATPATLVTPATSATPLPVNLANVDLGKISSILSSITSVMKNTGVSPVSRTSPGTPTTPSSYSSALKSPAAAPGGAPPAPNPLASILSRVDISPEGLLSALSKTQGPSTGLQGMSLLQSVTGGSSGTSSAQNPASTPPPGGPASDPPEATPAALATPGDKGPAPAPPPALKHKPLLGGGLKPELERKGGKGQEKEIESTPPVLSSTGPSSLESKIHKFLQGNPGFRAFNLGLPNLGEGQGSSSNSPSLATENLEGTPVRDEASGTPTQDEMMDEPGPEPFATSACGPAGAPPPSSHNGGIRVDVDPTAPLGRPKNVTPSAGAVSKEFGRSGSEGRELSPTAYRSDRWEAPDSPQKRYGEGPQIGREYRPLQRPEPMPGPRDASGDGFPPRRPEDFYDGRSEGAGGERRGPTAERRRRQSTRREQSRGGGERAPAGPPNMPKHEGPHYRHIETLVSTSGCGEGAPIEILGYNAGRRPSGERIQTVESIRVIGRGMRPHPRGGEAGAGARPGPGPGPGRGGWYGEAYTEGVAPHPRNPGPPPHGRPDDGGPRPRQPFPFEERGRMPHPHAPPHRHIPPSNFFSSPPPPIPPPPPPIPQLPPPPQDFLSPPSSVMVGGVMVPVERPSRAEGEERAGPPLNPNPPAHLSSLLGEPPLFKDLPHHGGIKEHFSSCQPPPIRYCKQQLSPCLSERLRVFEFLREKRGEEGVTEEGEGLRVRLPDGRTVKGTAGVTTPLLIAQKSRIKGAVVSTVNGELWELGHPLEADCELHLLGFDCAEGRQVVWRSGACVLGAVLEAHFGATVCRGSSSETSLYCDYQLENSSLSLGQVEEKCRETALRKLPFSSLELGKQDLQELFKDNQLRLQVIEEEMTGPTATVYRLGDSVNVCSGPLLPHTGFLRAFKMLKVSAVKMEVEERDAGVHRVLGVCFPGEREREEWEREKEEARRRDHRRIGKDQELFFFNDVSPGSCFFLPKGAHIYNTLCDFIKSEYRRRGFSEVVTPTLYSTTLWERSGHWEHYGENMFTVHCAPHTYALKPMNCPAHCLMYEQRVRSWRELPLRWADFGALHRNEVSGALSGLTRVRRFCQDDAHIFCTPDQLEEEITSCLDFVRSVYRVFGFSFRCLLSTRPTPCLGEASLWDSAEQQLERSLQQFGESWELNPGDGAFYGPKIDIQIRDAIGRQHQCATIQLDFQLPIRFNLQYVGADGEMYRPVMVHRAVLGSLERMIAILAENFGGKWPFWLSPAQVMVIPIGGSTEEYAQQVVRSFREAGFMADVDADSGTTLNKKIRAAQLAQYNYTLVVGERERENEAVSVRTRGGKQLGQRRLSDVLTSLTELRETRSNQEDF